MHLAVDDFCRIVKALKRTNAEKALAILWYRDHHEPGLAMTAGELTRLMCDHHVGTPNSTQLAKDIRQTRLASESAGAFSLKPGSRAIIREWLPKDIEGLQPPMDHSAGYLPEPVWAGTRDYIESVCRQLNGCFRSAYYDGASVMLRRLLETLVIEAYEHLGRQGEIKDGSDNYHMFGVLVDRATGSSGLNIGRNTKNALRAYGDKSAHDRRFLAVAPDLRNMQPDVRSGVQDLIHRACLKGPTR